MQIKYPVLLFCCLFLTACQEHNAALVHDAKVIDGDSLFVLTDKDLSVELRLAEIDAPERDQAHADEAREALRALVEGHELRVVVFDHDRYNRTVAHLYRANDGLHINAEMIVQGHAWAYTRFLRDESLLALQASARDNRSGLWAADHPIAPWEFRKQQRK